jgi:hypothetical protein
VHSALASQVVQKLLEAGIPALGGEYKARYAQEVALEPYLAVQQQAIPQVQPQLGQL